MFVCPVPKISQVMMKWRRRASHLGRFTLWHNGRRATQLGRFTLWHNSRRATQFSRFTLWRNGRRAKQPYARTSSRTHFQRTTQRKLLKYVRVTKTNSRPQETFEKWTPRTLESPHELARQCEAIRKHIRSGEFLDQRLFSRKEVSLSRLKPIGLQSGLHYPSSGVRRNYCGNGMRSKRCAFKTKETLSWLVLVFCSFFF